MKNPFILIAPLLLAAATAFSQGSPLYWDPNVSHTVPGSGGLGSWNTTDTVWLYAYGNVDEAWPQNSVAEFAGLAGTVTLTTQILAGGVIFATPGYTISSVSPYALGGTLTITVPAGITTINGILAGTSALTLNGPGTLVLTGSHNSYIGGTVISSGTLQIDADATTSNTVANLGPAPTTASENITLGGGTLSASATFALYPTRYIMLTNSSTIDVGTQTGVTQTLTVPGQIYQSGGSFGVTKTSAGILDLTGDNTFTGNLVINGGTITIGGSGKLNGGNIYAGNIATTANPMIGSTIPASFNYDSTAGQTLSGTISGGGLVAQNGTGQLTLSGTNTYTGYTTIDHGPVVLTSTGSISNSPVLLIYATGTLNVSAYAIYNLSTNTTLFGGGVGTGVEAATIVGNGGGSVNPGSQPINLFYTPTGHTGDTVSQALEITGGGLTLNNNSIGVSNTTSSPLQPGVYDLVFVASGNISGAPSTNIFVVGGGAGPGSGLLSGDSATASVSGSDIIMTVIQAGRSTTTTLSASPINYGQPITATISPVPDGGAVQFFADGVEFGAPVVVNTANGTATLPQLPVGSYTNFTAVYGGDLHFGASSATTATFVINYPPITSTATIETNGLQVCWPSEPGFIYHILTNGNLVNESSSAWVEDTRVSPITAGGGSSTCVTLTNAPPSTNLFVLIKQGSN